MDDTARGFAPLSREGMAARVARDIPEGWREGGPTGTKEECLAHIETVRQDMRPLSLRTAAGVPA